MTERKAKKERKKKRKKERKIEVGNTCSSFPCHPRLTQCQCDATFPRGCPTFGWQRRHRNTVHKPLQRLELSLWTSGQPVRPGCSGLANTLPDNRCVCVCVYVYFTCTLRPTSVCVY